MKICGFVRQSLIDWEGRLVAVVFTKGCNFRCGYCHNPYLVLPGLFGQTPDIRETVILAFLKKCLGWLDGVVISGGEPTLQPDLPDFIRKIKTMGYVVKLDTNGSNPVQLRQLIGEHLIDAVAMDVKSELSFPAYLKVNAAMTEGDFERVCESVRLIEKSGLEYQFRTTLIPGVQSPDEIHALKNEFGEGHLLLQKFRDGDILQKHLDVR